MARRADPAARRAIVHAIFVGLTFGLAVSIVTLTRRHQTDGYHKKSDQPDGSLSRKARTCVLAGKLSTLAVWANRPLHIEFQTARVESYKRQNFARYWRRTYAQRKILQEEVPRRWTRSGCRYPMHHSINYLGAISATKKKYTCLWNL